MPLSALSSSSGTVSTLTLGSALGSHDCATLDGLGLIKDSLIAPKIVSMVDFFLATPSSDSNEEDACVIPPSIEAAGLTTRLWDYCCLIGQQSTLSGYTWEYWGTSQTIQIDWTRECTSYCPIFLCYSGSSFLNQILEAWYLGCIHQLLFMCALVSC